MKPVMVLLAAAAGVVVVAGAAQASAATIKVTTTKDQFGSQPKKCSLREAIQAANTDARFGGCPRGKGADRIVLGKGTYRLTRAGTGESQNANGDLNPASPMTITGKGPNATIIDGNGAAIHEPVFSVASGRAKFAAMSIRNGLAPGDGADGGGAIRHTSPGKLTLDRMRLVHNATDGTGGAVVVSNAATDLTVTRSQFVENTAARYGGALHVQDARNVTIRNSVFAGNVSQNDRAGVSIYDAEGRTVIARTRITGNISVDGWMGGLYVDSNGGATLSKVTVAGNKAADRAGGIYLSQTQTVIRDSTISGNVAFGLAGGIMADGGSTTLINSTVSGNVLTAPNGNGGGVYAQGSVSIRSSTIAYNRAAFGAGIYEASAVSYKNSIVARNYSPIAYTRDCESPAPSASLGHNLFGDDTCDHDGPGDIALGTSAAPADPKLGVLARNGGPTPTHALMPGSPAIDKGQGCPKRDQRGHERKGRCDIGAFELGAKPPKAKRRKGRKK